MINLVRLVVDWAIEINFNCGDKYTHYECYQNVYENVINEEEYLNWLMSLPLFKIMRLSVFFIVGDLNVDVSDVNSLFNKHLIQFCLKNSLMLSSKVLLSDHSYTYINDAWHTTSWLDHCICSADAHDSLEAMRINYEFATTDHVPFSFVGNIPALLPADDKMHEGKKEWSNLTE